MGRKKSNKTKVPVSENKKLFIKNYLEYGTVWATLRAIGVKSRQTFYNWCESDPEFKRFYEHELVLNRRDELASLVYRVATGRLGTHIKTVTYKNGTTTKEEVPNEIPQTQLTAAFGFLKATDHTDHPKEPQAPDKLIFTEKYQLTGEGGGPLKVESDAKERILSAISGFAARTRESEINTEPQQTGGGGPAL